ncbi:MAG: hypothetical protein K2X98_04165 [Alphaproteobacteria bacterium]|nr:hypothetical protein [Alphaproteobacteria bacterium]
MIFLKTILMSCAFVGSVFAAQSISSDADIDQAIHTRHVFLKKSAEDIKNLPFRERLADRLAAKTVSVAGEFTDNTVVQDMVDFIGAAKNLESVEFYNCHFGFDRNDNDSSFEGLRSIVDTISAKDSIKHVVFAVTVVKDKGAEIIAPLVSKIQSLTLRDTYFGGDGFNALSKAINSNDSLTYLNVQGNFPERFTLDKGLTFTKKRSDNLFTTLMEAIKTSSLKKVVIDSPDDFVGFDFSNVRNAKNELVEFPLQKNETKKQKG